MTFDQNTPAPFYSTDSATLYHGEALAILRSLPDASVDAVITDPPYSSGGLSRSERMKKPSEKYQMTGTRKQYPEFEGDNRDQRSFLAWSSLWLTECRRVTREGGYLLCFTDWRQLPVMTDAIQCGGWLWRGIVPWDKTEGTRPSRGWFRAQCEYVLTASRGSMGKEQDREVKACLPGMFRENVRASEKLHMTGKPLPLMKRLLEILPPGSTVLDPFAGSGTTLLAAQQMNHRAVGIEMTSSYCGIIRERLSPPPIELSA